MVAQKAARHMRWRTIVDRSKLFVALTSPSIRANCRAGTKPRCDWELDPRRDPKPLFWICSSIDHVEKSNFRTLIFPRDMYRVQHKDFSLSVRQMSELSTRFLFPTNVVSQCSFYRFSMTLRGCEKNEWMYLPTNDIEISISFVGKYNIQLNLYRLK